MIKDQQPGPWHWRLRRMREKLWRLNRISQTVGIFAASLVWLLLSPATAAELHVAASIGPVQSLVAGVMGDTGAPALLIPGGQSPHTFAMRPSTARAIAHADVIFRIAPIYEMALDAPLANAKHARVIDLIDAKGVTVYPARDLDDVTAAAPVGQPTDEFVRHQGMDPHIWLDPDNARAIAAAIAATLSQANPQDALTYRTNEAIVEQWLTALDTAIKQDTRPVTSTPFIVFHDGYQYFERRYGLRFAGAVTEFPGRSPGAWHILKVRQEIRDAHVPCVFGEVQFEPRLLKTVTEGLAVRTGSLDPLGAGIAPGPDLYFEVMRGLSRAMAACLAAS